jgi:hypothetical protein
VVKHVVLLIVIGILFGCQQRENTSVDRRTPGGSAWLAKSESKYPDFGFDPPSGEYSGAKFKLSRDFPSQLPPELPQMGTSTTVDPDYSKDVAALDALLKIPFDEGNNWRTYLMAARDYCLDGMSLLDGRLQPNAKRTWYHALWLHAGSNGREGIAGLTQEATAEPQQVHWGQGHRFDTFAIAFYNSYGGYTLGRVWQDFYNPEPRNSTFPVGTVAFKLLFTQADKTEVKFLDNPLEIDAYATPLPAEREAAAKLNKPAPHRKVQRLRLLQMDIMVRDDRGVKAAEPGKPADHIGWVFGAFCYNGTLNKTNKWDNLVPIGLSWGNDPQVKDGVVHGRLKKGDKRKGSTKLTQTRINDKDELPPQHLGRDGRLNGPLDNPKSSCISCHSAAQYRVIVPMYPSFDADWDKPTVDVNKWFRNIPCKTAFGWPIDPPPAGQAPFVPADYSLQITIGLKNCDAWRVQGGFPTVAESWKQIPAGSTGPGSRTLARPKGMATLPSESPADILTKAELPRTAVDLQFPGPTPPEREVNMNLSEVSN